MNKRYTLTSSAASGSNPMDAMMVDRSLASITAARFLVPALVIVYLPVEITIYEVVVEGLECSCIAIV
jgi:hypothetical protein